MLGQRFSRDHDVRGIAIQIAQGATWAGVPETYDPKGDSLMNRGNAEQLKAKKCKPCEGGVPPLSPQEVEQLLQGMPGWELTQDGKRIRREWTVKDFVAAIDFFNRVAELAEKEKHHPDLHLVGYRNVAIELWTHAVGGLSENDFIVAAKIGELA